MQPRILLLSLLVTASSCLNGMYDNSHVHELDSGNFYQLVKSKNSSLWLIKFYAHWCGHCIEFSSLYKRFAQRISGWKPIVNVGAVDCAEEYNAALCRQYHVELYPTFRTINKRGIAESFRFGLHSKTDEIKCNLLSALNGVDQQYSSMFAPISPETYLRLSAHYKTLIIVIDGERDCLGKMMIMDFRPARSNTPIFRMSLLTAKQLRIVSDDFLNTDLPIVVHIHEKNPTKIEPRLVFLNGDRTNTLYEKFEAGIEHQLHVGVHETISTTPHPQKKRARVLKKSRAVNMVDLESTLSYMFKFEVACRTYLNTETVAVLRHWLWTLMKYFPGRRPVLNQLGFLDIKLMEKKLLGMDGREFKKHAKSTVLEYHQHEIYTRYFPPLRWINCLGSKPMYRGYPCGVWTLFHTLSVRLANQFTKESFQDKSEAVKMFNSIRNYMSHFFGCEECVQHFLEGTQQYIGRIENGDDLVLILWKGHNRANGFLSGALTEDPYAPKCQFPNRIDCPRCRDSKGQWIESEVLKFLKYHYSNIDSSALDNDRTVIKQLRMKGIVTRSPWIDLNLQQSKKNSKVSNGQKHSSANRLRIRSERCLGSQLTSNSTDQSSREYADGRKSATYDTKTYANQRGFSSY
ncbi:hypothetical protein ACOME3_000800 [Neoechinorhynchus agilis]